jgi:sugar/nucleoside kinase (ribokinase family)
VNASVEWIVGVLRVGKDHSFGTPYEFACTVKRTGDEVTIIGAAGHFTMSSYRAIRRLLQAEGIRRVNWDRLKSNKHIDLDISQPQTY